MFGYVGEAYQHRAKNSRLVYLNRLVWPIRLFFCISWAAANLRALPGWCRCQWRRWPWRRRPRFGVGIATAAKSWQSLSGSIGLVHAWASTGPTLGNRSRRGRPRVVVIQAKEVRHAPDSRGSTEALVLRRDVALRRARPSTSAARQLPQIQTQGAGWTTWLLSSPTELRIGAPPGAGATRGESAQLQAIAEGRDAAALERINYCPHKLEVDPFQTYRLPCETW
jgi:hypothetical protein